MSAAVNQRSQLREASTAIPAGGASISPSSLYESHFNFAWRNLARLGVPEVLLEDATQDVFLTLHRRFSTYDSSRSSIETWLFGIVLRVARGHRRTLRRRLLRLVPWFETASEVVAAPADDPLESTAKRQAARVLQRLLDSLDESKRAILILVDLEQLSVPEAAV